MTNKIDDNMIDCAQPTVYVFWNQINPCNEMPAMIGGEGILLDDGSVKVASHQSTIRPEHIIFITSVNRGVMIHAALRDESRVFNEKVQDLKRQRMAVIIARFPELKVFAK